MTGSRVGRLTCTYRVRKLMHNKYGAVLCLHQPVIQLKRMPHLYWLMMQLERVHLSEYGLVPRLHRSVIQLKCVHLLKYKSIPFLHPPVIQLEPANFTKHRVVHHLNQTNRMHLLGTTWLRRCSTM